MNSPVTMAVRPEALIPWVTCSAVVAEPNPLGPAHPVINAKIPISSNGELLNPKLQSVDLFTSPSAANTTVTWWNRDRDRELDQSTTQQESFDLSTDKEQAEERANKERRGKRETGRGTDERKLLHDNGNLLGSGNSERLGCLVENRRALCLWGLLVHLIVFGDAVHSFPFPFLLAVYATARRLGLTSAVLFTAWVSPLFGCSLHMLKQEHFAASSHQSVNQSHCRVDPSHLCGDTFTDELDNESLQQLNCDLSKSNWWKQMETNSF